MLGEYQHKGWHYTPPHWMQMLMFLDQHEQEWVI
jgi:hypothetical protein